MSIKDRDMILYALVVVTTAIFVSYSNNSQQYSNSHGSPSQVSFDEVVQAYSQGASIYDPENAGNHLYPYMASVTAMSCLLAVIFVIICVGGSL